MNRYTFIDKDNGNVISIVGWADERELPADYEIPANCNVKTVDDDSIDLNYFYDSSSDSFKLKSVDEKLIVKNQILQQLTELDAVLPRCVEDMISSLGMDVTKLPPIMQDRLKTKADLRQQLKNL